MKKTFLHTIAILFSASAFSQNVGIGTTTPSDQLTVRSATDTAISAITTYNAALVPAIYGYSSTGNQNQIGILGAYNGTVGYGSAVAAVGFKGIMPPAGKDIGLYGSQHTSIGRALYIDGQAQIVDGSQGAGKILTSDASGTASWKMPTAGVHAFASTYSQSTLTVAPNSTIAIPFDNEEYDQGNDFSTGVFTAPDTGVYHFDATIAWSLSSSTTNYFIESFFYVTDPSQFLGVRAPSHTTDDFDYIFGGNFTQQLSTDIQLDAGNTVSVYVTHNSSVNERIEGSQGIFNTRYSRFSCHKLF